MVPLFLFEISLLKEEFVVAKPWKLGLDILLREELIIKDNLCVYSLSSH